MTQPLLEIEQGVAQADDARFAETSVDDRAGKPRLDLPRQQQVVRAGLADGVDVHPNGVRTNVEDPDVHFSSS